MFRYIASGAVCLTAVGLSLAQQTQLPATPTPAATPAATPAPATAPATLPATLPAAPAYQACEPTCTDVLCPPGAGPRFWASAELLVWWVKGQNLPPLLTTSPAGTPIGQAGVLGLPGTSVLYGGTVNDGARLGGRFTGGMWLDDCRRWGIGGEFFFLGDSTDTFTAGSPGTPILARPFFNTATGAQDAQVISYPGVASGQFGARSSNEILGAAGYLTRTLCCTCNSRFGLLAGYRYLRMEDGVTVSERLTSTATGPGFPAPGTVFTVTDHVRTVNQFHGGDVGLTGRVSRGRLYFDGMARLGIGATRQEVTMNGTTLIQPPGLPATTAPGGLLAQGAPLTVTDTTFSLVPELRLNVGYRMTESLSVFAGYTILWWTNVARAGDQINLAVNPALIPPVTGTATRPPFTIRDSTVWVQGVSAGIALNY